MKKLSAFPQTIKTSRLELRTVAVTAENAAKLLRIINENRDYLEAWQGHFAKLRSVDDVIAYLSKRANQITTNEGICFYIYHNDKIIGRIRFFHIHDNECEIGYWLARSAAGHGYMSEALTALESELFAFGFDKITLDIDAGNTASENVAKRNGYALAKRLPMASWAKCVGKCDTLVYEKHKP